MHVCGLKNKAQHFYSGKSFKSFFFCVSQEPHRVYPSIPAAERRPLKVLSLFDGIATGMFMDPNSEDASIGVVHFYLTTLIPQGIWC